MATFRIDEGQPGQGKSLSTARLSRGLLHRNKKWYEKQYKEYEKALASYRSSAKLREATGGPAMRVAYEAAYPSPLPPQRRKLISNIKFSEAFEKQWDGWIDYWSRLDELHKARNADIIWDEIATELDSRNWPNLSPETMIMLSQYRKRGLDIYANTQDFSMVDIRARLMITSVRTLTKLIGSPDPSATKPAIKKVWGVILIRTVQNWKQVNAEKKIYSMFDWSMFLIERDLVEMYDTTQDIKQGEYPALRHVDRYCGNDNCEFHKVMHV